MRKKHARHAGRPADSRRKHRPHPIPKWLKDSTRLDEVARSRALMVLSVLSGEKPVTDAIGEAKISRGTYYQMEARALNAMLAALNPLSTVAQGDASDLAATRIETLLERIQQLEQDKRRSQRLLLLTRKSIRAPVTLGRRGRLPKSALLPSIPNGKPRLAGSKVKASVSPASTPTKAGESAR